MEGLSLVRGGRTVLSNLSFTLAPGQVLRLEGPNGSGKSTLLKALAGVLKPSAGTVRWIEGERATNIAELPSVPLYIGHLPALRDDLSTAENLALNLAMAGESASARDLARAAGEWRLDAFWQRPARELSAGQRRRIALAQLSVSRKSLWLLDEPSTALDAQGSAALRDAIAAHRSRGGLLAYASHDLISPAPGDDACLSLEPALAFH